MVTGNGVRREGMVEAEERKTTTSLTMRGGGQAVSESGRLAFGLREENRRGQGKNLGSR